VAVWAVDLCSIFESLEERAGIGTTQVREQFSAAAAY
jgi:hypothetical protein